MDKNSNKAWLYLLPAMIFLGVFMVYPLFDVIIYSVEEGYNFASQTYFGIGKYNYAYVLRDPYFLQALKNTFILVIITVPLSTGIALLISVGLNSITKLKDFFQTVFFLPYVTNTLAVGLVFMILFKKTPYSDGFVNLLITACGGSAVDFIDGPYWAKMFVMCFYTVWVVLPFKILILTSALASVNPDYYKAARLLQGGQSRRHIEVQDLLQDHASDDLAHDLLPCDHRIYRSVQGLQRRSRYLRNRPERGRNEHDRRLCLRHAVRRQRRIPVLRGGGSSDPVCNRPDHHVHKPADQ